MARLDDFKKTLINMNKKFKLMKKINRVDFEIIKIF